MRHLEAVLGLHGLKLTSASPPGYHPGRAALVELDGNAIGHVGELSPAVARAYEIPGRVGIAEVELGPLLAPIEPPQGTSPSVFPPVDFDLSFLVGSGNAVGDLVGATTQAAGSLVESAHVFDVFTGSGVADGERAVAIRYRLRAPDRTLTNEEVAPVRQAMIDAASAAGAKLRGA
jgi:phenylalanyl-tRNA synthetase beta chain